MKVIVPIPGTGYKAIWDTVTDQFFQDDNGDQAWDCIDDIDYAGDDKWERMEFFERISMIWGD